MTRHLSASQAPSRASSQGRAPVARSVSTTGPRVRRMTQARTRSKTMSSQVEDEAELAQMSERLAAAGRPVLEQKGTTCCYARSDKEWTRDPDGVPWETFRSLAAAPVYGEAGEAEAVSRSAACCAPPASACCA